MKPKSLKRREAAERQEIRNRRTQVEQIIILHSRPGESKREVDRLAKQK